MSFPYKALWEKPGFVSPEGDETPLRNRVRVRQANEKQQYLCLARHVLERHWLVGMKAMYPNLNAQKEYAMKQYAQQVRTRLLILIMAGVAGAGVATTATAAGIGGGVHADAGAGVQAADTVQAGSAADAHMSPSGSANGGAAERMNDDGVEMRQLGDAGLEATDTATTKDKRKR